MDDNVKLKKIIAAYTPFLYTQIDLKKTIKNKYIAVEFKDNFFADLCDAWPDLDTTSLYNELFVTIKTGKDILELINPTNHE